LPTYCDVGILDHIGEDQRTARRWIDNERGKGDHKHEGEVESAYVFTTLSQLLSDFKADVRRILNNG
jgi:hypothetical protein